MAVKAAKDIVHSGRISARRVISANSKASNSCGWTWGTKRSRRQPEASITTSARWFSIVCARRVQAKLGLIDQNRSGPERHGLEQERRQSDEAEGSVRQLTGPARRFRKGDPVTATTEVELGVELRGPLATTMEEGVGAILLLDVELEPPRDEFREHPEQPDEIALACAVRADQDVQASELEVFERADRLEATDGQRLSLGIGEAYATFDIKRSASLIRISPEISLGRRASRRAARVRDSSFACSFRSQSGERISEKAR